MAEILVLWNEVLSKNSILAIPLHHFQRSINQSKLKEVLEMEAVKAVNNVGIDINKSIVCECLRAPLSFISGFGPRKANLFYMKIKKYQVVMRLQLLTSRILTQKVFVNSCGFILVKSDDDLLDSESDRNNELKIELLDITRIHPDLYPKAKAIAKYITDNEYSSCDQQLEVIFNEPAHINNFDLNDFLKRSESDKGQSNNQINIKFIIEEFQGPFKDPRPEHIDLSTEEIFYLLINETKATFNEGHFVVAKVTRIDEQHVKLPNGTFSKTLHVKCKLSNGLDATLWIKDIFDEKSEEGSRLDKLDKETLKNKFPEGMNFQARIRQINRLKFKVDLTAKNTDLSDHRKYIAVSELYQYFNPNEAEDL